MFNTNTLAYSSIIMMLSTLRMTSIDQITFLKTGVLFFNINQYVFSLIKKTRQSAEIVSKIK